MRSVLIALCILVPLAAQTPLQFPDGVASGEATHATAVLWTRTNGPAVVDLELADNPDFEPVSQMHRFDAVAGNGFVVKPRIYGLLADHQYFYRFLSGGVASETGTFRTAPLPWVSRGARFAFSGDSDATQLDGVPGHGPLKVLDAVRADNPEFFIYLGDIVYTDSAFRGERGPAITLEEYRATYSENREDAALRELFRTTGVLSVWDDHEVANDWNPATVDPVRFANGRRAFLEQLPVSPPVMPAGETCIGQPMFRFFRWGADIDLIVLDERSCRSADATAACTHDNGEVDQAPRLPASLRAIAGLPPAPPDGCLEALEDPGRTFLGRTQKWLLKTYLLYSTAKFKFVVNEVAIQEYFVLPYDRWEGYAAERREILEFIRDNEIENVIFLTADAHANVITNVAIGVFDEPDPIAAEFITGPIATNTLERTVERLTGISGLVLNQFVGSLGAECWDLDAFAYGLVEVDAAAGAVTISLKDENGAVLRSKGDSSVLCAKTIGP